MKFIVTLLYRDAEREIEIEFDCEAKAKACASTAYYSSLLEYAPTIQREDGQEVDFD